MMTRAVFSFIILFCFCNYLPAQITADTLRINERHLSFSGFFSPRSGFAGDFLPDGMNNLQFNSLRAIDSSSVWMRARLQLSGMAGAQPFGDEVKSNLLSPLSQQFTASQRMKELKYILGTIQAGAVGYLAYQHLKKFGFLKKR
jgi:hypothetical protein